MSEDRNQLLSDILPKLKFIGYTWILSKFAVLMLASNGAVVAVMAVLLLEFFIIAFAVFSLYLRARADYTGVVKTRDLAWVAPIVLVPVALLLLTGVLTNSKVLYSEAANQTTMEEIRKKYPGLE